MIHKNLDVFTGHDLLHARGTTLHGVIAELTAWY